VRAKRRGLALRKRDLLARFAEQPWPLIERRWLAHGDDANGAGSVEHSQWCGNAALEMGPWGNPGPYFFLRSGSPRKHRIDLRYREIQRHAIRCARQAAVPELPPDEHADRFWVHSRPFGGGGAVMPDARSPDACSRHPGSPMEGNGSIHVQDLSRAVRVVAPALR
jgi:hypothetical protein